MGLRFQSKTRIIYYSHLSSYSLVNFTVDNFSISCILGGSFDIFPANNIHAKDNNLNSP